MEGTYQRLLKRDVKLFLRNENSMDQLNRALLIEIVTDFSSTAQYEAMRPQYARPARPLMSLNTVIMTVRELFPAVMYKLDECVMIAVACMEEVKGIGAAVIPAAVNHEDVSRVVRAHQQRVANIKAALHEFLIDQEFLMNTIRGLLLRILAAVLPPGRHRTIIERSSRTSRREGEAIAGGGRQSQPWAPESYVARITWNMMSNKELAAYYKEVFYVLGTKLYPRSAADDYVPMDLSSAAADVPNPYDPYGRSAAASPAACSSCLSTCPQCSDCAGAADPKPPEDERSGEVRENDDTAAHSTTTEPNV